MAIHWKFVNHWDELGRLEQGNSSPSGAAVDLGIRGLQRSNRCLAMCFMAVLLPMMPHDTTAAWDPYETVADEPGSATDSALCGEIEDPPDETSDEKQRIREIENRASKLLKERNDVERERRPVALRRDSMLGEAAQARQRIPQNQSAAAATERQIAQLEKELLLLPGSLGKDLKSQQTRLRTNLNTLIRRVTADRKLIDERMTSIQALNPQIAAIDQRLLRLNEQMSECRQQWLAIRQPFEKYSRGDFEGLRRVLDDWLVLDGQWPEAFAWAALCAYESEEMSSASAYLEKAQRWRAELSSSKKLSPQLEALTALIRRKQPGQSAKAEAAIANAIRLTDKTSGWETYFLLGRCYFERPEDSVRAKTHFQRALAIHPNCDCAKFWLARMQTTSSLDGVRDLYAGTTTLEQLWTKSTQRSWRLAWFLAEAYSVSQRAEDAEKMWIKAAELVPAEHKHRLPRH